MPSQITDRRHLRVADGTPEMFVTGWHEKDASIAYLQAICADFF